MLYMFDSCFYACLPYRWWVTIWYAYCICISHVLKNNIDGGNITKTLQQTIDVVINRRRRNHWNIHQGNNKARTNSLRQDFSFWPNGRTYSSSASLSRIFGEMWNFMTLPLNFSRNLSEACSTCSVYLCALRYAHHTWTIPYIARINFYVRFFYVRYFWMKLRACVCGYH